MKTPYLSVKIFEKQKGPLSTLGKVGFGIFVCAASLFVMTAGISLISHLLSHEWWENWEMTPATDIVALLCFIASQVGIVLVLTDKARSNREAVD